MEDSFALMWRALQLPPLQRERMLHPTRQWRSDFYEPDSGVSIEIMGGVWNNGGHVRGDRYHKDAEKEMALLMDCDVVTFRLIDKMIRPDVLERIGEYMRRRARENRCYRIRPLKSTRSSHRRKGALQP